jgi:hypothetical protein
LRTKAIPLILSINNHEDTQTINSSSLSVYQYGNHGTSAMQQKGSKRENEASGRLANFQS